MFSMSLKVSSLTSLLGKNEQIVQICNSTDFTTFRFWKCPGDNLLPLEEKPLPSVVMPFRTSPWLSAMVKWTLLIFFVFIFQCLLVHRGIAAQMELEVSQHSTGEIPCQQRSTSWVNTSWKPYCTNDNKQSCQQGTLSHQIVKTHFKINGSKHNALWNSLSCIV